MGGMSAMTFQEMRAEAAEIADRTSPLHVLDTIILAVLVAIGWVPGRIWWLAVAGSILAARGLTTYALAVRHGYRLGRKTQLKPVAVAPPAMASTQKLIDDERITDHMTPFGVPFGPNVQAYSEAA
jgi:hypothetical protein